MRSANRRAAATSSAGRRRARTSAVGRVQQRLGEQLQRADRGLQLVADVGHEVAADPGHAVRLGDVGGLDRDVAAAECRPRAGARRAGSPAAVATARQVQLDLAAYAGAPDLAGERTDDRVRGDRAGRAAGAQQAHARAAGLTSTGTSSASSTTTPTRSESRLRRPSPAGPRPGRRSRSSLDPGWPARGRGRAPISRPGGSRPGHQAGCRAHRPRPPSPPGDRRVIVHLSTTQNRTKHAALRQCSPRPGVVHRVHSAVRRPSVASHLLSRLHRAAAPTPGRDHARGVPRPTCSEVSQLLVDHGGGGARRDAPGHHAPC